MSKFLAIVFLIMSLCVSAQENVSLRLFVSDTSGRPISGATVELDEGTYTTQTNKFGKAYIANIKPKVYLVEIRHEGHGEDLFFWQGDTSEITIQLIPTIFLEGEVIIQGKRNSDFGMDRLRDLDGFGIYAGKKTEVVNLDNVTANTATNNARQIYGRVAGMNVFENDGVGLQLGIGGRGMNPNRVSNFNTRQNGYDISADALGYPESYYTPPTEALERIEVVRGAASLQYGTQFGGFINFKFRQPERNAPFAFRTRQSMGSFGLFNSFNAISGTKGSISYLAYYQYKTTRGYRENASLDMHGMHGHLTWHASRKFSLTGEFTGMYYLAKQSGGLTDAAFSADPRQSIRDRNWFKVNWNLFALNADYLFSSRTKMNVRAFGLIASRQALGFLGPINRVDPGGTRDLISDEFTNIGVETRVVHKYKILSKTATALLGARLYRGHTFQQQGDGPEGDKADFRFVRDTLDSQHDYPGRNFALFGENVFYLSPKFSVTPGLRFEYIQTKSAGYYLNEVRDFAGNIIFSEIEQDNRTNQRSFLLAGLGIAYDLSRKVQFYGNFSQNYRSITFSDMRINNPNLRVNPNLQDEKGFTADAGVRGKYSNKFYYDVTGFFVAYRDRIGTVLEVENSITYNYRTNIADSRNVGVEAYAEWDIWKTIVSDSAKSSLQIFTNLTYVDARYINSEEPAFENNIVEYVPDWVIRGGVSWSNRGFKSSLQYSFTGLQFSDATNAISTPNAVSGLVPAYGLWDFSLSYDWKSWQIGAGCNNFMNADYFTRRADGYPGPGILPGDGRSFYLSLQYQWKCE